MELRSFVAYIPATNNSSLRVAIGNCGKWEDLQFIEIEYSDNGKVIRFYNSNCKEYQSNTKEKFLEFQSNPFNIQCEKRFETFYGNEALINLLAEYNTQGVDFLHESNCDCLACRLPNINYSFSSDIINAVKNLFESVDICETSEPE